MIWMQLHYIGRDNSSRPFVPVGMAEVSASLSPGKIRDTKENDVMRLSTVPAIIAFSMLLTASVWAAEPNLPGEPEGHVLPDVTVSAPAEPNFTTLPSRDLMARP